MQARGLYSSNVLESKSHCRTKPSSSLPLLYLAVPLSILYILLGRSGWKIVPVNVWAQMHMCACLCVCVILPPPWHTPCLGTETPQQRRVRRRRGDTTARSCPGKSEKERSNVNLKGRRADCFFDSSLRTSLRVSGRHDLDQAYPSTDEIQPLTLYIGLLL